MAPVFVPFTLSQAIFNKLLSFPFVGFPVVVVVVLVVLVVVVVVVVERVPRRGSVVVRLEIACEASFDESRDNGTPRNARR